MALFDTLVAFIPMLGILIFVHELGHFLVAKACGVRVLKFSLGFGPAVGFGDFRLRWERGGTEYVIAWIPLGGFVKMLGENLEIQGVEPEPEALDARPDEFLGAKSTWQKLAITFAGPVMNLVFPILVFACVLTAGWPRIAAVVGTVEQGSPAEIAGLLAGDRLLAIDGETTQFWDDVREAVRERTAGPLKIEVERGEQRFTLEVPVQSRSALDNLQDVTEVGWIGITSRRLPALIGVADASSAAARADLRSGDLVTEVAGTPVEDWTSFRRRYEAASGTVQVLVKRGDLSEMQQAEEVELALPALGDVNALGASAAAFLVGQVSPDSAAEEAGLKAGDLLLELDGRPIGSFDSFAEIVRASEGRSLGITYSRKGVVESIAVAPRLEKEESRIIDGMTMDVYRVGIAHSAAMLPGERVDEKLSNPIAAIPRAFEETWEITVTFLKGLGKMATGGVSSDQLAGPIGIAEIARSALDLGWFPYLHTMVLISINLGILNLLPIPVLDGGQALIYMVEGVKGSSISLRSREIVQSIGLAMLAMLMGLAFWNDLSRKWEGFVEWLRGGL